MAIDIEEALVTLTLAKADVKAIVGQRVFPNRVPIREEMPAVIYRRLSGGPLRTLGSKSAVKQAVFQVESWSDSSQLQARTLDKAVQQLDGTRGTTGDWFINKITVNGDTDQDNPQIPIHAEDLGLHCSFCEMTVFYKASGL